MLLQNLKIDKNLVLLAVKQNGLSLAFVEGELKRDKEIITEAIKQNIRSIDYVENSMKLNKDIAEIFMSC